MGRKSYRGLAAALVLAAGAGGCVLMTAQRPLFAEGHTAPFLVAEGLWATREEACGVDPQTSAPGAGDCLDWFSIERAPDGAWLVREVGADGGAGAMRVALAPMLAQASSPATVALAEAIEDSASDPRYLVVVPRDFDEDGRTAVRLWARLVSCQDALALGPVEGLAVSQAEGRITQCTPETYAAAMEAGRSAALAAMATLGEGEGELVFVRPARP